ncbi:MAG: hypothetical protein DRJ65_01980 [Acidobacteria bacterium]|nr:MAG: hypothetical protein DRJ65_01980 [Acidobacteriota bacterium]
MKPLKVLFVCFANTCRSPMAESILRSLGGPSVDVVSAGLHPTGRVAELSLETLAAHGYEVAGLSSKGLEAIDLESIDIVISLMGEPGLAALPCRLTAEKVAWSIRDPYGEDEDAYTTTVKTLERKIHALCEEHHLSLSASSR